MSPDKTTFCPLPVVGWVGGRRGAGGGGAGGGGRGLERGRRGKREKVARAREEVGVEERGGGGAGGLVYIYIFKKNIYICAGPWPCVPAWLSGTGHNQAGPL